MAGKTTRVVMPQLGESVHEGTISRWLDAPVKRFGGLDVPSMPYAVPMEEYFMPTPEKITKALRELAAY